MLRRKRSWLEAARTGKLTLRCRQLHILVLDPSRIEELMHRRTQDKMKDGVQRCVEALFFIEGNVETILGCAGKGRDGMNQPERIRSLGGDGAIFTKWGYQVKVTKSEGCRS